MWLLLIGCHRSTPTGVDGHGPIAEDVSAPLGEIVPYADDTQRATFGRGQKVAVRRFSRAEGLGPAFNVTFCGACHERPVTGGSAGLYRNFFLTGVLTEDGAFLPGTSAGTSGGVLREYAYGPDVYARPSVPDETNVITQRNPIPFFGVGLLAELPEEEILSRADPDDLDGDGISGRPNYDQGFVGRFGQKAQTVSIENFIRGPLFNHAGITTDPLSEAQKAALPVDSASPATTGAMLWLSDHLRRTAQAAAPAAPLVDADDAPDPELSTDDLYDLVSFGMLLAAPRFDDLSEAGLRGRDVFDTLECGGCHVPRLDGPRGPIPAYTDLLLHDMGPELADGIRQGEAEGDEFRTQPLWGVAAEGPYLHDGRAETLDIAIRLHGGESQASAEAYSRRTPDEQADLVAFLLSLGGRSQASAGLLPPDTPMPEVGAFGGPSRVLTTAEAATFLAGRAAFDRDHGYADGVGAPRFNGDSCRACHFDPVIGGAGPRDVNVMRHGILSADGEFVPPAVGTVLHKDTTLPGVANEAQPEATIFEHRQTPALFGLGLVDAIPDATILALADPTDADGDGISGRASHVDGDRLGRFGWKAQVPTLHEFVRDAVGSELGMTLPREDDQTFGRLVDDDTVPDPEMAPEEAASLEAFLRLLAPPPRQAAVDPTASVAGAALFAALGCDACHTPTLATADGTPVPLYSDLLLHDILPRTAPDAAGGVVPAWGVEDASATMWELRTPPLWGLSATAPYLHSGEADTIEDAILLHAGEGQHARDDYAAATTEERTALLAFLATL